MTNQSENINDLATALSKAQAEIKVAIYDSQNPHFKNRYASLAAIWDACRQPLNKYGLSILQTIELVNSSWALKTVILHTSGQWMSGLIPIIMTKQDMQGLGSAITYARRYGLASMVGVVADADDDGHQASQPMVSNYEERDLPPYNVAELFEGATVVNKVGTQERVFVGGKYAGKRASEIPTLDLLNYLKWIEKQEKTNPPLSRFLKEARDIINAHMSKQVDKGE